MSKVISRRRPASAPAHCPPRMPAAGPDSRSVTGRSAALRTLARPPLEIITCRSERTPSSANAGGEPLQVEPRLRTHERAHARGGETLELAELGNNVRAGGHERVGHLLPDDRGGATLMLGIEVGVKEADGDRFDPLRTQLASGCADLIL